MVYQKNSPQLPESSGGHNQNTHTHHDSRCPTFPANERYSTHCRAVLACLLTGAKVDQFTYHTATGLPLVDFRTRISNLRLEHNWPIADEFHDTQDFNGEPRRVKRYWLNRAELLALFKHSPEFKHRCMLLEESFKQGGEV